MKPFARVEYVGTFGRWMVLSAGETRLGDFEAEGEARLICENINFAHRASVREELSEFWQELVANGFQSIDIDAFMDREDGK